MKPIVLVHGYSAESPETTVQAVAAIYGQLPQALRDAYGRKAVVEIDLSRYVTLEDGVTMDDLSRGLDRALRAEFPHLLRGGFHVIAHSTGALLIRNWVRRFSAQPCPIRNLIYLAGAVFGSGWAHLGQGQLAKWARLVFAQGSERGLRVLDALELGSDWAIDLHLGFLKLGASLADDYGVSEYVIVGTQPERTWFPIPMRYAKEDGSDGVVRVAASNVNFNYLRVGPSEEALALAWSEAAAQIAARRERREARRGLYDIKEESRPGFAGRPEVPLAITYGCSHSGEETGILSGEKPRKQVFRLVRQALETQPGDWPAQVAVFRDQTAVTYRRARAGRVPRPWRQWITSPQAQFDPHAQLIFRVRDQDRRPAPHFDIFFTAREGADPSPLIGDLFEHNHVNRVSPHIITFYLRADAYSPRSGTWVPRVPQVNGCVLEISAVEPETEEIVYLPLRMELGRDQLARLIEGHRTTVIDVELLRLPSPAIYRVLPYARPGRTRPPQG